MIYFKNSVVWIYRNPLFYGNVSADNLQTHRNFLKKKNLKFYKNFEQIWCLDEENIWLLFNWRQWKATNHLISQCNSVNISTKSSSEHSEISLKCNLDRTELQRRTCTVLRIFNLITNTSIQRNLQAELYEFRYTAIPLKAGFTLLPFSTAELDGIYLNNYRMCPHFTKGSGSGVAAPAITVVHNLRYILWWMLWVNVWSYPAMCGLRECAKHGKCCGYFCARFYAWSFWQRPLICYEMLPYLSACSTKYVECEQNHTLSS
jgi:hypothetical protein